jgi:predicted ribosomally synthesized peptide with SipW-like signal peptide
MKKKIILLCTAAVMIAVLAVGATLAYLTDKTDPATNTFAIGEVKGYLLENGINTPEGIADLGTYVNWIGDEDAVNILPNQPIQKAPKVQNIGKNDAFVRISAAFERDDIEFLYNGAVGYNAADWLLYEDNYYYKVKLAADADNPEDGAITSQLFDAVRLSSDATELTAEDFEIVVYAELIQADYLDTTDVSITLPVGSEAFLDAVKAFALFDIQNPPTP